MKSKNCQKVVVKALGHILYGSNFIASDVKCQIDGEDFVIFVAFLENMNFTLILTKALRIELTCRADGASRGAWGSNAIPHFGKYSRKTFPLKLVVCMMYYGNRKDFQTFHRQ